MFKNSPNKKQRGQGIVKVSTLFDKYKKTLRAPQKTVVGAFIVAVEEVFEYTIKSDQCSYNPHTKVLSVSVSGPLKSEIKLEKKHILNHMRESLGDKSTPTEIL